MNNFKSDDNEVNDIYKDIKELIVNSRNKVYKTVNTEMINLYWNIGKIIIIIIFLLLDIN